MVGYSYKKNVAEGRPILLFSILFATILRTLYYFYCDIDANITTDAFLWSQFSFIFQNKLISFIASNLFLAAIAFYVSYINTKHTFIRNKTYLPPSFFLLLFSCHPVFIIMRPEYIVLFIFLYIIDTFFQFYNSDRKQIPATKTSFSIGLGSLIFPVILVYIPVLWMALATLRSFNGKALLASFFGLVILYFPLFSFYLLSGNIDSFLQMFNLFAFRQLFAFTFLNYNPYQWFVFGFIQLLGLIILIHSYFHSFKDKIKVRSYFRALGLMMIISVIYLMFISLSSLMFIFIILGLFSFILAHYFALSDSKSTVFLFYFSFSIYLIICNLAFAYY